MGQRRDYLIKNIVDICQRMDLKGYVANHDGNVSVKFDDYLLATPTAEAKASITEEMVITLDQDGKKVEGIGKPFSEISLHIAAYRSRPDAKAVVHAHPPYATARGLVGKDLEITLPEGVVSIGDRIPVAPFAMPGAAENAQVVSEALGQADVFLMAGNGVLAIGDDLEQAYLRLELVEHIAKIDTYAQSMGQSMRLSDEDRQKLLDKRHSIGLGPKARGSSNSGFASPSPRPKSQNVNVDQIRDLIASELKEILRK